MNLPGIGDIFDRRFRIDDVLGRGGFAAVFAATELGSGRPVAVKVIFPDRGGTYEPGTRARFEREVAIGARLSDPHTVQFLEHGVSPEGLLYAVFERVPGVDLIGHLEVVGRMPPDQVGHVLRQVLLSLREAHAQGLLHRDIKPSNIRIFEAGGDPLTVKLLDFGLARATDDGSPSVTKTGELIGTPRYMAPEQLLGRPVSPASDVYSLGMVAWEMLDGREALAGPRWGDQVDRLLTGHVLAIGEVGGDLGPGLVAVLQRMTAREPQDRYPTAAAALAGLDALERPMAGRPRVLPAPSPSAAPAALNHAIMRFAPAVAIATIVAVVAFVASRWGAQSAGSADTALPSQPSAVGAPTSAVDANRPNPLSPGQLAEGHRAPVTSVPDAGQRQLSGCGAAPHVPGTTHRRGRFGAWWLHVPANYDPNKPHPVLIVAHPTGIDPRAFLELTDFTSRADEDGVIVLAPIVPGGLTSWNDGFGDVPRLRAMFETTAEELCVDQSRVWVAGHGKGGRAAAALGCEDWVQAIATNSFSYDRADAYCTDKPRPTLYLLPKATRHVPQGGGAGCTAREKLSFEEMERVLAAQNQCEPKRPRRSTKKGGVCYTWTCEPELQICHIEGGNGWRGQPPRPLDLLGCDGPPQTFDAGKHMWEFFLRQPPLKTPAP